ncbi:THAP domain-containing protein 1-like [Diabrotica virgifera virgifera]|uniref:THAP-type domain-containing protein n=1 Tax=Diabrotica virgifera virgifera TaxID=50390 RepID=A0ABM5JS18_DIAVI|nr:THAP domain-containing protein 1-like [Diabrotica virgifera virgifera]
MPGCAVANCKNYNRVTKGSNIKYFRFPQNEEFVKQWVVACRRQDEINLKNACICSKHFDADSFEIPLRHKLLKYTCKTSRYLKPDAVPTLQLPGYHDSNLQNQVERVARLKKRRQHKDVEDMLRASTSCILNPIQISDNDVNMETETSNPTTLPVAETEKDLTATKVKIREESRPREITLREKKDSEALWRRHQRTPQDLRKHGHQQKQ